MSKQQIKTAIVIPDLQVPYHDKKSLDAVEQYMANHKWDYYINLGDFLDLDSISHHTKGKLRQVEGKRILKDYQDGVDILDRHMNIIKSNNKKAEFYWIEGNHENRVERWLDENPAFEDFISIERFFELEKKGIKYIKSWSDGEHLTIGKAHFTHGGSTTDNHAKSMVKSYGESVFYGHTHDVMSFSQVLKGKDKTIVGQSMGCLCEYNQSYMQGRPSNWQQAFGVFHFFPDGHFTYYVPRIFKHRFVGPDGVVYQG